MNWLDGMNKIITYIEENLEQEIEHQKIADILGYSIYHCQRLFMLISGVSLADYIRNRRLSKAAEDLLNGEKVIDVAMKYGYSSPNSFNRAFKGLHGIAPSTVKKGGVIIKTFPPLSFELSIKGVDAMEYRVQEVEEFRIVGKKLSTTIRNGESYQKIPAMWKEMATTGAHFKILELMDQEPSGLLGVSDYNPELNDSDFDYYIAVSSTKEVPEGLDELIVGGGTWAIFTCQSEDTQTIQKTQERMVMEWLPNSGYEFANRPDIEVSFPDGKMELWLPIVKR
ncbi:MAG: GyrI-like domain-containing protein [Coprobacillaceae bacterium]